ncbi:MAG: OsmC family protein [Bacteroidetes bacterium]|nr:OsmC family protein [Bacteroidota bacterium]
MEIKINTLSGSLSGAAYTTLLNSGGHLFYADEPLDHGGSNKGPRPHDFLLAALASCTCITVRMYADRKGWKLDDVTTNVKWNVRWFPEFSKPKLYRSSLLQEISMMIKLHVYW